METSSVSPDDIKESSHAKSRPIEIPNVVAGYMADLIISYTKEITKAKSADT